MARKKQSLRRSPSASGTTTPVMSSAAQVAQAASASTSSGQRTAIESKNSNRSTPPIAPNAYFTSDMGDYKMPTPAQPIAWLTVLWRRYEATFAISMLETWESVLLHSMLLVLSYGIYWASTSYLPDHIRVIAHRTKYYWSGTEEARTW